MLTRTAPTFVLKAQPSHPNVLDLPAGPFSLAVRLYFLSGLYPFKFADYDFQFSPDGLVKLKSHGK